VATTNIAVEDPPAALHLVQVVGITAAIIAAVAHVPPTPAHLREVPYIGLGFVVLTALCLTSALILAVPRFRLAWRPAWSVGAVSCSVAIAAYLLSRSVGLPGMSDDIGHWTEPLGLVSICSEAVVVVAAGVSLRRVRR